MNNEQSEREWYRAFEIAYAIGAAIEEMVHREVFGDALRWR